MLKARSRKMPLTPKKTARALPRSRRSKAETTMASAAGKSSAAPTPWTTRQETIHAPASEPSGVAPHSADETANTVTPMSTIRR